jgi:hypothetical protein
MGKESLLSAINPLGGAIVFKNRVGATERYELTLLGVFLSDHGPEAEELLASYLEYIRAQFQENPMIEKVTAAEVQQALRLTEDKAELLGRLIVMGYFYGSSASSGKAWECGVPADIDDLPTIPDLRKYAQERAGRDYDPKVPIESSDRLRYSPPIKTKEKQNEFEFIQDPLLREQLANDWDEVKSVREVRAWKSCVILCGGILEGMLLDVLKRDEEGAKAAYQKLRSKSPRELNSWDLVDVVDAAKELGLLSKGVGHLSHGLREFRNLVHPGKQIREKITLTEEEAEIACKVVQVCLREFFNQISENVKNPSHYRNGQQKDSLGYSSSS